MRDFIEFVGCDPGANKFRCMIERLRRELTDPLHLLDFFFGLYGHGRSDREPTMVPRPLGLFVPLKTKNPDVSAGAFKQGTARAPTHKIESEIRFL